MRTIIAGSRTIKEYKILVSAIKSTPFDITTIISGTATGVDQLGERYASLNNIPVEKYPADWDGMGKRAGYVRNEKMAKVSEALIAIWDGVSKGTLHMIKLAYKYGLLVHIYNVPICNDGHYFEIMDRSSIITDMWNTYILDSQIMKSNPELSEFANKIMDDLADFYQKSSKLYIDNSNK